MSVMPSRDVHIDDAHRRITQHITLEGLALDSDAANRTHRPEEFAHASYPWLLLISPADITTSDPSSLSTVRAVSNAVCQKIMIESPGASLILLDDDCTSIVTAIRLGRRIYDNLHKAMA